MSENSVTFFLKTKAEAEEVLDAMKGVIQKNRVVTVSQAHDLMSVPTRFTDELWGWKSLDDTNIQPIKNGYLLSLPRTIPLI